LFQGVKRLSLPISERNQVETQIYLSYPIREHLTKSLIASLVFRILILQCKNIIAMNKIGCKLFNIKSERLQNIYNDERDELE
jgi:hypothetical protein